MKKLYVIPNIITAFGLACGLFVIFKMNMVEPGEGHYNIAKISVFFLLLAAFADFIDGAVARLLKAESEFGVVFDSLADAISFGVAPSVLILKSLSLEPGTLSSFFAASSAMIYSMCGVLRLVRFNTNKAMAQGNILELTAQMKHFTGLPIPAAAAGAVSLNLLLLSLDVEVQAIILPIVLFFLGYLMVSKLKFPSFKLLNIRLASFHLVFVTVLIAVFFIYGFFYFFPLALSLIAWGYILLGLVLALVRFIAGKKSKTLEDFEPDDEDYN